MTANQPAGDKSPRSTAQSAAARAVLAKSARSAAAQSRIRVGSVAGFLAIVPHLLGFRPARSMVVVGLDARRGRVALAFRYDLPDPPDPAGSKDIADHAAAVLAKRRIKTAIAAGYGPGRLVTPVAESVRSALGGSGIGLRDLLRVEDGGDWSYGGQDPGCCPGEGVPFEEAGHPAAPPLDAAGMTARPDRASLAASLAPLDGPVVESMARATERALRRVEELVASAASDRDGQRLVVDAGRSAVREAIGTYRGGGRITDHDYLAWLAATLADLRVRDDAWGRVEPEVRGEAPFPGARPGPPREPAVRGRPRLAARLHRLAVGRGRAGQHRDSPGAGRRPRVLHGPPARAGARRGPAAVRRAPPDDPRRGRRY